MNQIDGRQARNASPIGVFDSGVGGLSIFQHINTLLPNENLIYFADSGHAPYGSKSQEYVIERSLAIAEFLVSQDAKALVIACNTATVAAIRIIRQIYPDLVLIGVEPGLKPAAARSTNGKIGILATERTLASERFAVLRDRFNPTGTIDFIPQPCPGLADLIESGELAGEPARAMLTRFLSPLLYTHGADTLVLGCTHYPFVRPLIESLAKEMVDYPVMVIDTGEPVAKQLHRVMVADNQLYLGKRRDRWIHAYTSGEPEALEAAFSNLLSLQVVAARALIQQSTAPGHIEPVNSCASVAVAPLNVHF